MRIARELKIHKCAVCASPLSDEDFLTMGLNLRARLQIYFDYHCPRCAHRGRYNVNLKVGVKTVEALQILAAQIDDDDESSDSRIDWDSIKWE